MINIFFLLYLEKLSIFLKSNFFGSVQKALNSLLKNQ